VAAVLAGGAICLAQEAAGQAYPVKSVHLVVPYPPGGAGDLHVRLIASKLSPLLGQPVVVENRAGASGNIGSDYVAKAPPDGYTLLMNTTNMAIARAFSAKVPFNVLTDLAPITMSLTSQNLLVVRNGLPVTNVKELIAYSKANPGKLSYGSSGIGTPMLTLELMKMMAGLDILHVPYKGDAPAINDLLGGQIDIYATNILALEGHHRAGRVRGLGVTSSKRAVSLPDLPTIEEAGIPGYELETWFGYFAPAGTPRPIIDQLNAMIVRVIAMPDVNKTMIETGAVPTTNTPDEFKRRIEADVEKFTRVVKTAGIKLEQ
jgi:tripartite-type tricarboxylate transporter receptor subunit TctC